MFNRIRRVITRTRERHAPSVRYLGALTPTRPTLIRPKPSDELTLLLRQLGARTNFFSGEETALVRPYILAGEQRTRHSSGPIPPDLLAHTYFVLAEALG